MNILDRRDRDYDKRDRRDSERRHSSERSSRRGSSHREWSETPRFKDSPATPNIHVKGIVNRLFNKNLYGQ